MTERRDMCFTFANNLWMNERTSKVCFQLESISETKKKKKTKTKTIIISENCASKVTTRCLLEEAYQLPTFWWASSLTKRRRRGQIHSVIAQLRCCVRCQEQSGIRHQVRPWGKRPRLWTKSDNNKKKTNIKCPSHIYNQLERGLTSTGKQSVKRERNHEKQIAARSTPSSVKWACSFGVYSCT